MHVRDFITALGGARAVGEACGVSPTAVANWAQEGIPARHWLTLWRLAKARGLEWRPPGAEDLDIVPRPDMGGDDAAAPTFAQRSRPAPQRAAEEAA